MPFFPIFQIIDSLKCENILQLMAFSDKESEGTDLCLIYPFMSHGSVADRL